MEIMPLLNRAREEVKKADEEIVKHLIYGKNISRKAAENHLGAAAEIYNRLKKTVLSSPVKGLIGSELEDIETRRLFLDAQNMSVAFNKVPRNASYKGICEYFLKLIGSPSLAKELADTYVISHIGGKKE